MVSHNQRNGRGVGSRGFAALAVFWMFAAVLSARAALQFDVFLGYDSIVPEACWFPVICEVKNDGPAFTGTVEVDPGNFNPGQVRRAVVELPTGTRKRLVVPVFSTTRGSTWDVRLLDERGKVRAEQTSIRPRKQTASYTPLLGALPRDAGGTPVLRPILPQQEGLQPASARLLPAIFPDNPLVLEGMAALYLNSEKASELNVNQVNALLAWLNAGGHLIIGVEQVGDISATPWLGGLFPCELKDMQRLQRHPELQEWLKTGTWGTNRSGAMGAGSPPPPRAGTRPRNSRARTPAPVESSAAAMASPFADLPDDLDFEAAELMVGIGEVRQGHVDVAAGDTPLMVTAERGRGRVTALLFSPEREPFRSWKNLPAFWAKLADVPSAWYTSSEFNQHGGWSSDGIFGAMLDSRQVHKLPVGWLLLLLLIYLVVIGPLDQYWLKRIGRPMLTWITFPCYVVLFSLVIYFIGYKLRAGESEWNELHVVDVFRNGERAELRGRTYASVYSPSNQRYTLESQQKYATFRGDFAGMWGGNAATEKANVLHVGDAFKAEVYVPVWTSQLFVSDWWQTAAVPMDVAVTARSDGWEVKVDNRSNQKLTNLKLAVGDCIAHLGDVAGGETKTFTASKDQATSLRAFVWNYGSQFQEAVQARQRAFGASESGRLSDLPNTTVAVSFLSQLVNQPNSFNNFIAPPGLDISPVVEHGSAVVLAWADGFSPAKPLHSFSPKRSHRNTLWRVAVPVKADLRPET